MGLLEIKEPYTNLESDWSEVVDLFSVKAACLTVPAVIQVPGLY